MNTTLTNRPHTDAPRFPIPFWLAGLLPFFMLCLTLLAACGDDGDDVKRVSDAAAAAFAQKYPAATVTEWESENGCFKADFYTDGRGAEAWFSPDGTWVRTETDLLPTDLPAPVRDYVTTNHAAWRIDDADLVETPATTYYALELEAAGQPDIHLALTPEGTLYMP